jgi:hypothetical protein
MAKTFKEVEELKRQWEMDPCWDLCETEGFEEYATELKDHQEKCEREWNEKRLQKEKQVDEEADKLGVRV